MVKCTRAMRLAACAALVGSLVTTVSAHAVVGAYSSPGLSPSTTAVRFAAPETAHVNGTVINTDGQPIAGLEILLGGANGSGSASGTTDVHGAFSVPAAAGTYSLFLIDSSGIYVYGCYEGPSVPGQFVALTGPVNCRMVTLSDGETLDIDMTDLRARHIQGSVAGSDGTRLSMVFIDPLDAGGGVQGETRAADGSYSLTVPAGSYLVQVYDATVGATSYSGGCYSPASIGNISTDNTGCQLLDLTASDATGVNMTLPTKSLTGLTITGTVTGPDGSGLPNIQVDAWDSAAGVGSPGLTLTDGSGFYSLTVPSGNYQIGVNDWALTYPWGCYSPTAAGHLTSDYSACPLVSLGSSNIQGIDMSMPLGGQTPTGTDVSVTPSESGGLSANASISFSQVDTAGTTKLEVSTAGPEPSGFSLGLRPTYYDISTDAAHTGPVTVCLPFDPVAYSDASALRLYHFENGAWKDVTTSVSYFPTTICGVTASLSPFAIGQAAAQRPQSVSFAGIPASVYGAGPITLTATASSGLPVSYAAAGPCAVLGSILSITAVGTCTVTASQAGDSSWAAASPVSQSFTITPAPLKVTAPSTSRTYGAANTALTPTFSGFVNGDTAAALTTQPTCTTTATTSSPIGAYPIDCSGAVDSNYSFTYVAGTLTIAIADRFVTATNTTLNVAAPGFLALTSAPGATVLISTQPAGKLALGSGGAFTYVPKTGFRGPDVFAYRLRSANSNLSAPVTVAIYVVGMGMNCAKCNLSGLGLSGANLVGANLASANMAGAGVDHANLALANLSNATLTSADLTGANLILANLSNAVLSYATLDHANLALANLSKATLTSATLTSANLTGANLTGANLSGSNLAGATLQLATVRGVGWSNTACPDGTNSSKDGGTCVGHLNH
jgi:uncharacterized protein YjbI with pentapeptide repeats/protocatechuate 3,4-dioxygenase beta subunit